MRIVWLIKEAPRMHKMKRGDSRQELGVMGILKLFKKAQLRCHANVQYTDNSRIPKQCYNWKLTTKKPMRHPRKKMNPENYGDGRETNMNDRHRRGQNRFQTEEHGVSSELTTL